MSALYVRNHAIRFSMARLGAGPAHTDVEATLRAVDLDLPQLYFSLARNAELSVETAGARGAAVLLQFAAVQLADDLADDDCGYLSPPRRAGPGAQWILQHLYQAAVAELDLAGQTVRQASHDFVQVGAAQQVEVRTAVWDRQRARAAAIGLNALQHRAYFSLVLDGTPLASRASELGYDFGFSLHVAGDKISRDRRWEQLDPDARRTLTAEATAAVDRLAASQVPSLQSRAEWFRAVLGL